jgi:hypothetical protein
MAQLTWTTLRPSGDILYQCTPVPVGTHYTCINEEVINDATYVYGYIAQDIFSFPDYDVPSQFPFEATVSIYCRAKVINYTEVYLHINVWTTNETVADYYIHPLTSSWVTYIKEVSWSWGYKKVTRIGFWMSEPSSLYSIYVSNVYVKLNYTSISSISIF